jgi:hypothetical protein
MCKKRCDHEMHGQVLDMRSARSLISAHFPSFPENSGLKTPFFAPEYFAARGQLRLFFGTAANNPPRHPVGAVMCYTVGR